MNVAKWELFNEGDYDKAKEYASQAVQLDSKSLGAKIIRGVTCLFRQDYKAAEADFAAAWICRRAISPPATTWPWPCANRATT